MPLPIEQILPQLKQCLAGQAVVVLEAPPGAGKTTRVPLALLDSAWLKGQKILMLEPRRLAARSAAGFMAHQLAERVGQTVGYHIRYEHRSSQQTRIEVITEGILTRRLQSDPELKGVGLVIFDEFHERNIHSDIALALTNDLRKGLREDLKILVMSATLDSEPLIKLLGAQQLRSAGRQWPVETFYCGEQIALDCVAPMARIIAKAVDETEGDILAFLPGVREIEQLRTKLSRSLNQLLICPLHGSLKAEDQQRALKQSAQRKLILATNIAETSLTIDGVETVVDSGLCRQPGFDPGSGLTRLQTKRISQASSQQRAGRAGRQGPGFCYRLWNESCQAALLPQTPPEIRSADLAPLALDLCHWGVADASQLDWLDPPPAGALAAARLLLQQLGLTDRHNRLSDDGRRATELPVHPRFASLLLQAERLKALPVGCLLSSFLAEVQKPAARQEVDLSTELRSFCVELQTRKNQFSPPGRAFNQLASIFKIEPPGLADLDSMLLARLVAHAYPDRIACASNLNGDYRLSNGHGAKLPTHNPLCHSRWLATSNIRQHERLGALISQALPLDQNWVDEQIKRQDWQTEVVWDEGKQRVQARKIKRFGLLELCSKVQTPSAAETQEVLCKILRAQGLTMLNWTGEIEQFLARIALIHSVFGEPWPDLSRNTLLQQPETWLAPYLEGIKSAAQLKKFNLLPALQGLLDWQQSQELKRLAPLRMRVPTGDMMKLDYQAEGPVLPVKLQQLFGLAETPSICQGRIPLKLHLLSPAGRALAVTSDLHSFWNQVYPEVQKEMKGRYPKHPWPDDPWSATPTRRVKKKS